MQKNINRILFVKIIKVYVLIQQKKRQEIIKRSNKFERETKGTKDEFNIYKEHIKYVYEYVVLLSENEGVNLDILKLSAHYMIFL